MVKEDRDGVVVDAYEIIALYGDKVRTKCTKFGAAASYCDVVRFVSRMLSTDTTMKLGSVLMDLMSIHSGQLECL